MSAGVYAFVSVKFIGITADQRWNARAKTLFTSSPSSFPGKKA
uniref:Uncharacterized protein n=1 Tax=Rhizophora mucronata TaxID=61149 RepID=A0A2P2Q1F2_RHIMU